MDEQKDRVLILDEFEFTNDEVRFVLKNKKTGEIVKDTSVDIEVFQKMIADAFLYGVKGK